MRTVTKLVIAAVLICLILAGYFISVQFISKEEITVEKDPKLKYILIWTNPDYQPISFLGKGQNTFENYHCPVNNCYVTSSRKYLPNMKDFDVILFHGVELSLHNISLPAYRSPHQLYVFASMESSHYYPIKSSIYNNYFNLTWTYKLNSDLYFGYMIIRNTQGEVIGPNKTMHWLDAKEMHPIDEDLKKELSTKKLAAAWFVSNCKTPSKREEFAKLLKIELGKHNLTLDIYGRCGDKKCDRSKKHECDALIKGLYYFYLSFENSFSEDYVTEKLLKALLNNAVPVVYGGANYTRFLPDGAYLNARELGVQELARRMIDAIENKQTYYDFFKWKNHYSYHNLGDSTETNAYCNFCSRVNQNETNGEERTTSDNHTNLTQWWNAR